MIHLKIKHWGRGEPSILLLRLLTGFVKGNMKKSGKGMKKIASAPGK